MSLINSDDKKKDLVNFIIIISVVMGFMVLAYAVKYRIEEAYYPVSGIIITALGGTAVKANRKTS